MDNKNEFNYSNENHFRKSENPNKVGFGKTIFIPFLSGICGAGLIVGICFGIPQIKEKLIGEPNFSIPTYSTINKEEKTEDKVYTISDFSEVGPTVAAKVLPSIVGIEVSYNVNSFWGTSTGTATGSGIIISEDGYIITNNHVISTESSSSYYEITKSTGLKVKLYGDDKEYEAKVIGTDSYTDIAVIKIDATGLIPATLGNSDEVRVGEYTMAIGNPIGMDFTVTQGIISAINREVSSNDGTVYVAIQTDAAINSGNSGGALVNLKGELIGVNTLKISGSGVEGIGFAIPVNSITDVIEQLIDHQNVTRPFIGITGQAINSEVAELYSLPKGISVQSVIKDSPAEKAGIKQGDIIIKFENTEVTSVPELNRLRNNYKIGDTVTLTILRKGKEENIQIILGKEPENIEDSDEITEQNNIPNKKNESETSDSIWDFFR
ncbi:MAG: trypsin-like peptidase domain-containing protein [Clostridia bacterium]|nr:trypsin-like peptidase domain-containing protein [Clostridia bacterium]